MAVAARDQSDWRAVAMLVGQVATQSPAYKPAWLAWFNALNRLQDYHQLEVASTQCLQHSARDVPALVALATAQSHLQRQGEALEVLSQAVELQPGDAVVWNSLGIVQKELGQKGKALESFQRALKLKPTLYEAYWNRSDLMPEIDENELRAMEKIAATPSLPDNAKAMMHYAMARGWESIGDYDRQFQHVKQGADLKSGCVVYDHQQAMREVDDLIAAFPSALPPPESLKHSLDSCPVFICGLPRTGTTLVEQILSSHSQVVAGDELVDLPRAIDHHWRSQRKKVRFPDWVADAEAGDWQAIRERYMHTTSRLQQTRFFTDKNLNNYRAIGVIARLFPESPIIICQRNTMDVIWGCYQQWFGDGGLGFTYRLDELMETALAAERLVAHWQGLLGDRLHVVKYETLVSEHEATLRDLLHYVGLPWEPACLDFHQSQRPVKTVSALQVRQPLHGNRVGRWQQVEPHLRELHQQLQSRHHILSSTFETGI